MVIIAVWRSGSRARQRTGRDGAVSWFWSPGDWLGRLLLQRGLALVYVLAFVAAARQGPALLGDHGLLPVARFVRGRSVREVPSLFTLRYSDRLWRCLSWA